MQGPARLAMRDLIGVPVERWLNVESPEVVRNTRLDLLGVTAGEELVHLELHGGVLLAGWWGVGDAAAVWTLAGWWTLARYVPGVRGGGRSCGVDAGGLVDVGPLRSRIARILAIMFEMSGTQLMNFKFRVAGVPVGCAFFLTAQLTFAQTPSLTVQVEGRPVMTLTSEDLAKMPRHTAVLKEHGTEIPFEGVLMHDVLERAGAPFGNDLRGKALSSYVLATAQDGYQVVYTLTEMDPAFVDDEILIADRSGGKPLGEKQGPFRIVVLGEKKPARSLRMLARIQVTQLRK